jgi:predicted DNA-binding transcriptional regulator YafY
MSGLLDPHSGGSAPIWMRPYSVNRSHPVLVIGYRSVMPDSAARLLELLSLLQGRDWPGSELAARLEVSPRTIRRDIGRLRDLGYPVEATMGAVGGYRLVGGTAMPPLLLDDEEAVAITVGLRTLVAHAIQGGEDASVRALAKLQQVLPPRLRGRVAAVAAATGTLVWDADAIDPERLALLSRAIVNRERLRFEYEAADGSATLRTVEPHSVVAAGRRWYLVAWDADRGNWRTFRVDRIGDLRSLPGHVVPRELPAKDGAAWLRATIEASAPVAEAVALVEASARSIAIRFSKSSGTVEPIDGGHCRVRLHADTIPWLAMRLLLLEADFVVETPPELRDYLRALGGRVVHAVGGSGSTGSPAAAAPRPA